MKFKSPLQSAIIISLLLCGSCTKGQTDGAYAVPQRKTAVFTSSDKNLECTFSWAKKTALSYAHDDSDPVGFWYEAALPNREAFCMRDVAHQSVGAHIIGLLPHNRNLFGKFVNNITESKDYCTFWEINRYDLPAPADYANDREFWYNLNANFDIIQACWRMFEWTGNHDYVSDPSFRNFFDRSVGEYVDRWELSPEKIMERKAHMNVPENFNRSYPFHASRGLPSYCESYPDISAGIDLVAALAAGHEAYASICHFNGNIPEAEQALSRANAYRDIIDLQWWDNENSRFNTYLSEKGEFGRGEGVPHLLWFGGVKNPDKIRHSVSDMLAGDWNVENLSAFPYILYRLGYNEDAYRILTSLPTESRADYPEVSYALIEGIVCGAMGLVPSALDHSVATLSRIGNHSAKIENVPLWGGFITLSHKDSDTSELCNNTISPITWNVSFPGEHKSVTAGQNTYSATVTHDIRGNLISTATIPIAAGATVLSHAN